MNERDEIRRRRLLAARRGKADDLTLKGEQRQGTRGQANVGKGTPASKTQRTWNRQRQREA